MKVFILCITLCAFLDPVVSDVGAEVVSVSVTEGDSVTLYTRLIKSQQEKMKWYFNNSRITQISGSHSKICTDADCKERFRDRLEVDDQTGSLTVINIRTTDSGLYQLEIISHNTEITFNVTVRDVSATEDRTKKVGESVTLDPGVIKKPDNVMVWYFNGILLAEITGDQSKICENDECKERFRDRLKVNQTGSLTIKNIRTRDSGEYHLQINSSRFSIIRSFCVSITGDQTDDVLVIKGDSVTLHTGFKHIKRETRHARIKWYFNDIQIAEHNKSLSTIFNDLELFRDRLKLNNHTGDLSIRNISTSDSGLYKLQINIRRHCTLKMFNIKVDFPAAQRVKIERKSVKEGESVILHPGVIKNPNDEMTWHFNDSEITRDIICTHEPCADGRFRDRLKLDNQTGSLTITNITTQHAGHYRLHITSSRFSIKRTFNVTVNGSGWSSGTAGIHCVLLLFCCSWLQLLV